MRVVIIGGGFAGVRCALELKGAAVDVTLIDRRNFHLFQPLLYQVATGGLSPGDISAPLRTVLKHCKNTKVILGEVTDIDVAGKAVVLASGQRHPYDVVIVATGARHSYFGKDQWESIAPGLKSIEDATEIRARVLEAFERAETEADPAVRAAWLTFVVVGGGPTGVEMAGALGELAHQTMRGEFRSIDPGSARIIVVEGAPRILSMYVDKLAAYGIHALEKLGVEIKLSMKVVGVDKDGVDVEPIAPPAAATAGGAAATTLPAAAAIGKRERIAAKTVLWAAGVAGSPLAKALKTELDRSGRVVVEPDCTVKDHPEIFVLGDLANFAHTDDKKPLPGVAPTAMQMGRYAADVVKNRIAGKTSKPFHFVDKGTMAVIGRNKAVARVGFGLNLNLHGFLAWLAWLFIHIMYLVDYENRLLVVIQWANYYFTRHRGARLISGVHPAAVPAVPSLPTGLPAVALPVPPAKAPADVSAT